MKQCNRNKRKEKKRREEKRRGEERRGEERGGEERIEGRRGHKYDFTKSPYKHYIINKVLPALFLTR
jgi:hypothetical protein